MAENKTMDEIHRHALKKFHTLCGNLKLSDDEKKTIIFAYGVESSRDLDTHDLIDICGKLSARLTAQDGDEMDKLRKRCIAAIGNWLKSEGRYSNVSIIKGIACQATQKNNFNRIPRERLRNLINAFNNKVKDAERVKDITENKTVVMYPREK